MTSKRIEAQIQVLQSSIDSKKKQLGLVNCKATHSTLIADISKCKESIEVLENIKQQANKKPLEYKDFDLSKLGFLFKN